MDSRKIIAVLLGIGLVVAGLSGQVVLGGTNISTVLVVAGIFWLIIEIIGIIRKLGNKIDANERSDASREDAEDSEYRSIDEWVDYFRNILKTHFPEYTLKECVPVTELTGDIQESFQLYKNRPSRVYKAEWGKDYDFVLYSDGKPKVIIMLGGGHCHTSHVDFLIAKMFARKINIPYLGFYLEFPNKEDYVIGRIREQLG